MFNCSGADPSFGHVIGFRKISEDHFTCIAFMRFAGTLWKDMAGAIMILLFAEDRKQTFLQKVGIGLSKICTRNIEKVPGISSSAAMMDRIYAWKTSRGDKPKKGALYDVACWKMLKFLLFYRNNWIFSLLNIFQTVSIVKLLYSHLQANFCACLIYSFFIWVVVFFTWYQLSPDISCRLLSVFG